MTRAPSDTELREILATTQVIGMVGASLNPARPSFGVAGYLVGHGYRVIGVNPGLAGQMLFGTPIVASVADLPAEVDMLDVFRRSEAVPQVVEDAIKALPNLRTIWLQLGLISDAAEQMATRAGITFVQDRCPKIDHARLIR